MIIINLYTLNIQKILVMLYQISEWKGGSIIIMIILPLVGCYEYDDWHDTIDKFWREYTNFNHNNDPLTLTNSSGIENKFVVVIVTCNIKMLCTTQKSSWFCSLYGNFISSWNMLCIMFIGWCKGNKFISRVLFINLIELKKIFRKKTIYLQQ